MGRRFSAGPATFGCGRWTRWEQEHDAGPIPAQYLPARPKALAPSELRIAGSDLVLDLMTAWAKAYTARTPNLTVAASGGGTGSGIQNLATGKVQVATGSRRMRDAELAAVRASGFEPLEVHIADEALAVCVAATNPLPALTLEQLASIYRADGSITRWSQLDVTQPLEVGDAIAPVKQPSNTTAQMLFRVLVLGNADSRADLHTCNGAKDLATYVADHPAAIGFCPVSYLGDGLRAVPIAKAAGAAAVAPTPAAVADGSYPLLRPFYVYFRDEPSGTVKAFVAWLRSAEGRALTQENGLVPRAK